MKFYHFCPTEKSFWLPWKLHYFPPWKQSFRRPWLVVLCALAGVNFLPNVQYTYFVNKRME